jgi:hypothetical protein
LPPSLFSIEESAFRVCSNLTAIEAMPNVEYIGEHAFSGCLKLADIEFGNKLKKIGTRAFAYTSLETVLIPKSVEIMDCAFDRADNLRTVIFEDGMIYIPRRAISSYLSNDVMSVTDIQLPNSIEEIGKYAFSNCSKIVEIVLPPYLRNIEEAAFENCTSIKNVVIPSATERISDNAFNGCHNLSTLSWESDSLINSIGKRFIADTSVREVCIPCSIKNMAYAFDGAACLEIVIFEDGTKNIPNRAFSFENGMGSENSCINVFIPESIISISQTAFIDAPTIKIHCVENSYAHLYAKENNLTVTLL